MIVMKTKLTSFTLIDDCDCYQDCSGLKVLHPWTGTIVCTVIVCSVRLTKCELQKHENRSNSYTNNNNNNMIYITTKREITQTFISSHAPTDERTQKSFWSNQKIAMSLKNILNTTKHSRSAYKTISEIFFKNFFSKILFFCSEK